MENKTLATDFYELTMGQVYFNEGMKDTQVVFDIFFRKNPFNGGYTISGGLEETINYVKNFKFGKEEIDYLRGLNTFTEEYLDYLANLKFKGDIYAVQDGTAIFPNEPILKVKADIITAQLLETSLLTNFNAGALVVTKAKRITSEAKGNPVADFGERRGRSIDSAIEASKYAYIGGCASTSNVYAARKYGIPASGTGAHSQIMAMGTEDNAFEAMAKTFPKNTVLLIDTYDTLNIGINNAIKIGLAMKKAGNELKGVRIDSGDLLYITKEVRKKLDAAGLTNTKITVSNSLDEYSIRELVSQGAPIDFWGVGENMIAPNDRVGGVYKLSQIENEPKIKISNDTIKTTNPGDKKVYRFYDQITGLALGDVIALAEEKIPLDKFTLVHPTETWKQTEIENYKVRELLIPIFINGELVYNTPTINKLKNYCEQEYQTLHPGDRRIQNPHEYYVDLTDKLRELKQELIAMHTVNTEKPKEYVKK